MPQALADKLVIAISSRALFDLEESNRVLRRAWSATPRVPTRTSRWRRGRPFLIRRLLALKDPETGQGAVEVILVSKNDANTGLRVFNSIEHHKINITRAAFTCGRSPYTYLSAFKADLFLSANPEDVSLALQHGYASATLLTGPEYPDDDTDEIRIAFDGDAVLFSDEAERVFKSKGLEDFTRHEVEAGNPPFPGAL